MLSRDRKTLCEGISDTDYKEETDMLRKLLWIFFGALAAIALVVKLIFGIMGFILIVAAWAI